MAGPGHWVRPTGETYQQQLMRKRAAGQARSQVPVPDRAAYRPPAGTPTPPRMASSQPLPPGYTAPPVGYRSPATQPPRGTQRPPIAGPQWTATSGQPTVRSRGCGLALFLLLFALPLLAGLASCVGSIADSITSDSDTAEAAGPVSAGGFALGDLVLSDPMLECDPDLVQDAYPELTTTQACVFAVTVAATQYSGLPIASVDLYDVNGRMVPVNFEETYNLDRTCYDVSSDEVCDLVVVFRAAKPGFVSISHEGSTLRMSPDGQVRTGSV